MKTLISINKVSTGYKTASETKIVGRDISTSLQQGELVCLLGANGAGKSTLMRSMCGFLPTLGGDILLNGNAIESLSDKVLARQIAVVLTDKVETENITIEELVGYGRSPYTGFLGKLNKEDKNIVNQSIEQCGISDKKQRQVHSLSDGERQKVMIAKALAQDTPIILLDEPTAFLDLPTRVDVMQLLRELASKGKSILMSTHDLDLALQLADKIWLMNGHGNFEHGTPEDLLIENAIQNIFNKEKISYNPETGAFHVNHQYANEVQVEGIGFGVILLQRALSRKGIRVVETPHDVCVKVTGDLKPVFSVYVMGDEFGSYSKTEDTVINLQKILQNQLVKD